MSRPHHLNWTILGLAQDWHSGHLLLYRTIWAWAVLGWGLFGVLVVRCSRWVLHALRPHCQKHLTFGDFFLSFLVKDGWGGGGGGGGGRGGDTAERPWWRRGRRRVVAGHLLPGASPVRVPWKVRDTVRRPGYPRSRLLYWTLGWAGRAPCRLVWSHFSCPFFPVLLCIFLPARMLALVLGIVFSSTGF